MSAFAKSIRMEKVICDDFRANVKVALADNGLSQSDLARRLNCTPGYISQLLSGRHDPGLRVVESIAHALNTSVESLLRPAKVKA